MPTLTELNKQLSALGQEIRTLRNLVAVSISSIANDTSSSVIGSSSSEGHEDDSQLFQRAVLAAARMAQHSAAENRLALGKRLRVALQ